MKGQATASIVESGGLRLAHLPHKVSVTQTERQTERQTETESEILEVWSRGPRLQPSVLSARHGQELPPEAPDSC